jgi:CheY-like chemotaxis protein
MQVFLVDDDPVHRRALAALMERWGFIISGQAGDGNTALSRLSDLHPDLIITDCQMPQMDGIAFARHLRERGDATPLIMISGQQHPEILSAARHAGVDCFICKPIDVDLLLRTIRRLLPACQAA